MLRRGREGKEGQGEKKEKAKSLVLQLPLATFDSQRVFFSLSQNRTTVFSKLFKTFKTY
jgi:hypothetical protein